MPKYWSGPTPTRCCCSYGDDYGLQCSGKVVRGFWRHKGEDSDWFDYCKAHFDKFTDPDYIKSHGKPREFVLLDKQNKTSKKKLKIKSEETIEL